MTNKTQKIKWTAIASAIAAVLLVLMILAQVLMNKYPELINPIFGSGDLIVSKVEGTEDLDAAYYDFETDTVDESLANAREVTREIVGEGAVLLKNDNGALPLNKSSNITLFNYDAYHPNMSGGEDPRKEREKNVVTVDGKTYNGAYCFDHAFKEVGYTLNPGVDTMLAAASKDPGVDGYKQHESSFSSYGDAAVITFKRNSGEGNDQTMDMGAASDHRTGLSLTKAELQLLQYVCDNFDKVVVIINSANVMELGFLKAGADYVDPYTGDKYDFSNIKSAIWCGGAGSYGPLAVAQIIAGEINPSGGLSDIYISSLRSDPTYVNFGSFKYSNSDKAQSYVNNSYFVEYEEGIYVGYRYYETAAYEASKGNYEGFNYDEQVVYPFGYGMSYTTFETKYASTPKFNEKTNEFTFNVNVKNTGTKAGKKTVQIYVNVPYDAANGVEKAYVTLAGFAKTGIIEPGKDETVTVTVNRDYFTSYDYKNEKCYILDAGDYNFILSDNSHSWTSVSGEDKVWTYNLKKKIVYNEKNKRPTELEAATNRFDKELNWKFTDTRQAGYATNFSRSNFKGTFPTKPEGDDFVANDYVLSELKVYNVFAESEQTIKEMPETGNVTGIKLADMRGIDYDSAEWDSYIKQFTPEQLRTVARNGAWQTGGTLEELGVVFSYDCDGPYGFFGHSSSLKCNIWYPSEPVLGATFNVEMARKMGAAIGEEANKQNQIDKGQTITGWYGPGANTHRSAFGGRNYEYYSEDPILSGKMLAAETSAASEKGLITYAKHFALNEQETNRQQNGYCAWAHEQALREIYVKAWEIYSKEAKMTVNYYEEKDGAYVMVSKEMSAATGIMTAYNRIGAVWAGASNAVSGILRAECGFNGISLTDAGGEPNTYMNSDKGMHTGNTDLLLANSDYYDYQSATAVTQLQQSVKRICFNKVNSNAYIGVTPGSSISYTLAPWQIGLIVAWVVVGLLIAGGAVVITLLWLDKLKPAKKA